MGKRNYTYMGDKVTLQKDEYRNNGTLAVSMNDKDGELYGVLTVNLNHPMQSESMAFLDENNMPGIGKWIERHKLGVFTGVKASSGFCVYPLYSIVTDNL